MIIDIHYHLIPALSEEQAGGMVEFLARSAKFMGKTISKEILLRKMLETAPDPTGERLLAWMEESGIDFTCICANDPGIEMLPSKLAQKANRIVGDIAKKYPDRVLALAGINPTRPEASDMLKQCFEEYGVRGLKYHPDFGYDPAGSESYKLLKMLQENGGILLTHTGTLMPPMRSNYAEPGLLADLGVDFPDLKVIAAHMGWMNWRPWASLAFYQPNLYGDLAAWDAFAFGKYEMFCRELRYLLDYADASKVLFGTDSPVCNILEPTANWIRLIKELPKNAPEGIDFTEEEVAAILGGNAASILGLNQ